MAKRTGRHKLVKVAQTTPVGYPYSPYSPYYPPQQQVVYVERPTKKKVVHKKKHKMTKQPKKEMDVFDQYDAEVNALYPEELDEETSKGKHKVKKEKDLFESYEEEMNALFPPLEEEEDYEEERPAKKGKHRVKKPKDSFSAYEKEIQFLAPPPEPSAGIHKVSPEEQPLPIFAEPEEIPIESQEDWFKAQQEQWKKQQEEFIKMGESAKKLYEGTAKTFTEAKRKARMVSRGLKSAYQSARRKFGLSVPARPPVQVFIEPTKEGDYVVYGQVTKTEVPVARPTRPIKVFVEPPKEQEIKYEELMA